MYVKITLLWSEGPAQGVVRRQPRCLLPDLGLKSDPGPGRIPRLLPG